MEYNIYDVFDQKNIINFLEKTVSDKFNVLNENYLNKIIAIKQIKENIILTIGIELTTSIVCYDGINTLIPMTGIIFTSALFSIKPIKLLKKSNSNIDFLEQTIPCLQEELIISKEKLINMKKTYNKELSFDNLDINQLTTYTDDNLVYEYSNNKKKVKVRVKK